MDNPHFEGLKGSFTLTQRKGEAAFRRSGEYRKTATVQAVQIDEDFTVNSEEGTLHAEAGDWLAEGPAGELWSIKEDIFALTYVPVDNEIRITPTDETLILRTLSQQAAKKNTYEALKKAQLPIPADLRKEIEDQ